MFKEKVSKRQIHQTMRFEEAAWALNNNVLQFIDLRRPSMLDNLTQKIKIFDVMTKTSIYGFYNDFQWEHI